MKKYTRFLAGVLIMAICVTTWLPVSFAAEKGATVTSTESLVASIGRTMQVSYKMDGSTIIEVTRFTDVDGQNVIMNRSVKKDGTGELVYTKAQKVQKVSLANQDYDVFLKLATSKSAPQTRSATVGSDVTGSQYKHVFVSNLSYTMPELQIIPQEEFEAAQRIREDRSAHAAEEAEHHVPLRTRGQALLSNNVYCGHCGARLALTTSRKWRKLSDGTLDDTLRIRYTCYGKLRKQTDCTGQTGYTMHILDEIIDKMVRQIFSRLRGIPKEQLITSRYAKETAERKNHLQALQAERDKAEKDLLALKTEILAVIKGESAFPKDTLAEMIAAQEKKHTELDTLCEEASAELERNAELMANVSQLYEELISYADLYDSASFEAKKMIVSQLIRRVEVYRGYQIHVDFNFDLAQYLENSDELAC